MRPREVVCDRVFLDLQEVLVAPATSFVPFLADVFRVHEVSHRQEWLLCWSGARSLASAEVPPVSGRWYRDALIS